MLLAGVVTVDRDVQVPPGGVHARGA
jgi:hypothetical protein